MRLTAEQQQVIRHAVLEHAGPLARVTLFGSRVDDEARGGDIDLLVESPVPVERPAWLAATLAASIDRALGGRKVDVVLQAPNLKTLPVHLAAKATGVVL